MGRVRICPRCGATAGSSDRFCELDGAELTSGPAPAPCPARACPLCREGTIEADGFCSTCGRRPSPETLAPGARVAGGEVVASLSAEEHLVRLPEGETVFVIRGEPRGLQREGDGLEQLLGFAPFPRVAGRGVDAAHGAFIALASDAQARPIAEVAPTMDAAQVAALLRALLDAAGSVERLGLAWEPARADIQVRDDGALRLARLRVPRKLAANERLDARAIVEAVGTAFVPAPALAGPPRALRLLLPHVAVPGDRGSTIDDVRAELDAIDAEGPLTPDDGTGVAGVCNPGLRRSHNEDALATASGVTGGEPWTVLVVCDGVSSSTCAEQASAVASKTACDALAHFARSGDQAFEGASGAVSAAIRAAHVAVCAAGIGVDRGEGDPPGTTIVVGLLWRRRLTIGWIGDSRAYWISQHGAELLTRDHSWATDAIARGEVTEAEAALSPFAHALTRCLGPLETAGDDDLDRARERPPPPIIEVLPEVRSRDLPGPGWIVLCSDGFWNYFSRADAVARLVSELGPSPSPALVARRLVNHALVRGGQDNTTVLVHRHR